MPPDSPIVAPSAAGQAALDALLELFEMERIDPTLFRGRSRDLGWGRVYGGQVLGQAILAAGRTVPEDRPMHSMHAYFLRPGDPREAVVYLVDPIRDGGSFATRRIVARQKGVPIFTMAASFHGVEEGLDHQAAPPDVAGPSGLMTDDARWQQMAHRLPAALGAMVGRVGPLEVRAVGEHDPIAPPPSAPKRAVWIRARGTMPPDPTIHRAVLAYASDSHFLVTALQPHGAGWLTPGIQMASLDHALWFHRPFLADDWLLYEVESDSLSGSRGHVRGRFFQNGQLVATAVQEGLIRTRPVGSAPP